MLERLEKELITTRTEIIKTENRVKGPLMAELKVKEALISRFENRDELILKQLKVLKSILKTPRMMDELRKAMFR